MFIIDRDSQGCTTWANGWWNIYNPKTNGNMIYSVDSSGNYKSHGLRHNNKVN